jgi:hypothetical protein
MSANSYIDQMKALSIDDEKKNMREKYKADMQADIDANGASWDSQINSTQNYYDKQIGDTKTAYDSEYQKNAVQKLINVFNLTLNTEFINARFKCGGSGIVSFTRCNS